MLECDRGCLISKLLSDMALRKMATGKALMYCRLKTYRLIFLRFSHLNIPCLKIRMTF